jgi:preprotein translocase subunit SecE
MGFRIYKPGQGYWTRLVTGLAGGVIVLGGAYWLWENLTAYLGIYARTGIAIVPVVILGLLLFRWTCLRPPTVDFLVDTEGEMKKVNWPSRREVMGSTWIVIACILLFVGLLWVADLLFSSFFKFVGVLEI